MARLLTTGFVLWAGWSSSLLYAGEAKLDLDVEQDAVVLTNVDAATVAAFAKAHKLPNPKEWPAYKTTGHNLYRTPASILRREKSRKQGPPSHGLDDFGVAFETHGKQRVMYFYSPDTKVLAIIFANMSAIPDTPRKPARSE
jgi:hypothetical protein